MIDDVGSLEGVGVVVVIEVDQVVLRIEAHDDAVFQGGRVHEDLAGWDIVVRGDALHEVHEQLGLGYLAAHLEVLLGLDAQQHEGEDDGAHPRVPPTGPHLVAQVEDAEDEAH